MAINWLESSFFLKILSAGRRREDGKECWVAVSTAEFARKYIDSSKDPQKATAQLQEETLRVLAAFSGHGKGLPAVVSARVQVNFASSSARSPTYSYYRLQALIPQQHQEC